MVDVIKKVSDPVSFRLKSLTWLSDEFLRRTITPLGMPGLFVMIFVDNRGVVMVIILLLAIDVNAGFAAAGFAGIVYIASVIGFI